MNGFLRNFWRGERGPPKEKSIRFWVVMWITGSRNFWGCFIYYCDSYRRQRI